MEWKVVLAVKLLETSLFTQVNVTTRATKNSLFPNVSLDTDPTTTLVAVQVNTPMSNVSIGYYHMSFSIRITSYQLFGEFNPEI